MINNVSFAQTSRITPSEANYINKTFRDAQKRVKGTEVRDADYALYAAQSCLAKDLVKANEDETKLIITKMDYLQNIINQNMEQDQDIFSRELKDKGGFILTKAEAKSKILPARAEVIRGTGESASQVINSISDLANNSKDFIVATRTPKGLELVA